MTEAEELRSWSIGVQIGINSTVTILQALVMRRVLTEHEAMMLIDDMAHVASGMPTATTSEREVLVGLWGKARTQLRPI